MVSGADLLENQAVWVFNQEQLQQNSPLTLLLCATLKSESKNAVYMYLHLVLTLLFTGCASYTPLDTEICMQWVKIVEVLRYNK